MRRALAALAVLGLAGLSSSPAAALPCLNSKPCGDMCIAWNKVCHVHKCRSGFYLCNKSCIPDGVLCPIG
jgi:hypothetical protein